MKIKSKKKYSEETKQDSKEAQRLENDHSYSESDHVFYSALQCWKKMSQILKTKNLLGPKTDFGMLIDTIINSLWVLQELNLVSRGYLWLFNLTQPQRLSVPLHKQISPLNLWRLKQTMPIKNQQIKKHRGVFSHLQLVFFVQILMLNTNIIPTGHSWHYGKLALMRQL